MARACIKSKAPLKSEGRTGNRGPARLGMADSTRLCSLDADLESLELASRGESGSPMTRSVLLDSRLAEDIVASGSLEKISIVGESPVGFRYPSSDEVICPGSKARAGMIVGP